MPGGDEISEQLLLGKGFFSPLLMKLSLAGYEILGKVLFFKDVEYWPPLSSGL